MMLRYSNIAEVTARCYVRKRPSPLPPACCFCMLLPFALFSYWPHVAYITICIYISRLQNAHPYNTTHSNTPHQTRPVWVSPGCVWLVANFRVSIYTIGAMHKVMYIYTYTHIDINTHHTQTRASAHLHQLRLSVPCICLCYL